MSIPIRYYFILHGDQMYRFTPAKYQEWLSLSLGASEKKEPLPDISRYGEGLGVAATHDLGPLSKMERVPQAIHWGRKEFPVIYRAFMSTQRMRSNIIAKAKARKVLQ